VSIPKKSLYILLLFLILLNIGLRYPLNSHESGKDSFFIHGLADSMVDDESCPYYLTPLSYFGHYPFSYPSAVPLLLGSISSSTGLEMELTVLFFTMLYGVASALNAFLLAREIKKNTLFNFIVAFFFSTSPGMLDMSTWQVSARGLFIMLTPLLLFLLIRGYRATQRKFEMFKKLEREFSHLRELEGKEITTSSSVILWIQGTKRAPLIHLSLFLIFFITIMSIHRLFFYLIPLFVAYFIAILLHRHIARIVPSTLMVNPFLKQNRITSFVSKTSGTRTRIYVPDGKRDELRALVDMPPHQKEKVRRVFFLSVVAVSIILFFFPYMPAIRNAYPGVYEEGSILKSIWRVILVNGRYIGIPAAFGIIGFFALALNEERRFGETFILLATVAIIPFLVILTYTNWFLLTIIFLVCGYGFMPLMNVLTDRRFLAVLVSVFLIIIGISAFFQVTHPKWLSGQKSYNERHMTGEDYDIALYMKYNARGITFAHATLGNRVATIAKLPTIEDIELYEPYLSSSESSAIKTRRITDQKFWSDGAYYFDYEEVGGRRSNVVFSALKKHEAEDDYSNETIAAYNIEYCLTNNLRVEQDDNTPIFFRTVGTVKYKLFDNGKGSVWLL